LIELKNAFGSVRVKKCHSKTEQLMSAEFQRFGAIAKQVSSGSLSPEEGLQQFLQIKYAEFDLAEIQQLLSAEWLPLSERVSRVRNWLSVQDCRLLQMRAWLFANPAPLPKARLMNEFLPGLQSPSTPLDLNVTDIVRTLATCGGTQEFVNPLKAKLIQAKTVPASDETELASFFDDKRFKFLGPSKPDSALRITLPPFLLAQLSSYVLEYDPETSSGEVVAGSLKSWDLSGFLDNEKEELIDRKEDNNQLRELGVKVEFKVEPKGFFRTFQIKTTAPDHQGGYSFHLTAFRLTGSLKLTPA
jgi:hypothetical protein